MMRCRDRPCMTWSWSQGLWLMQARGWLDWKRYSGEETLTGGNAECWFDWMRCRGSLELAQVQAWYPPALDQVKTEK